MSPQANQWNKTYVSGKKVWGDKPSELAVYACNYLKESSQFRNKSDIYILDLGCGYGRDDIFLAQNLPCHILALDNSEKAIEMARESIPKTLLKRIELLCYDFTYVTDQYDVIFVANLYHLLHPDERERLMTTIQRCLRKDGLLFLSTFSTSDPQHYGKGARVENEEHSFIDEHYMRFSSRAELEKDFAFLKIPALFEWAFRERRTGGDHRHVAWLLMGKNSK
jgi:SAM-dependent methyltransferase